MSCGPFRFKNACSLIIPPYPNEPFGALFTALLLAALSNHDRFYSHRSKTLAVIPLNSRPYEPFAVQRSQQSFGNVYSH